MNTIILKQISLLSLFLGIALGIVTTIPVIGEFAFWILMCAIAPIVMLYMIKLDMIELKNVKESVIIGSIIGFIAFLGFSFSYIPLVILLLKLFNVSTNYGVSLALSNASFGLILVMVLFISVLSATVNAFSGFLTYYGIDLYKIVNKEDETFKLK